MILSDRIPPQNIEAEAAVLGACMLGDPEASRSVFDLLRPDSFYGKAHQAIFDAQVALAKRGEPVDQLTVVEELRRAGKLDVAGGPVPVAVLVSAVGTPENAAYHAAQVHEAYVRRTVLQRSLLLAQNCYDRTISASEILNGATGIPHGIELTDAGGRDWVPVAESVWGTIDRLEEAWVTGGMLGVPSGFSAVDDMTNGFQPGEMAIIASRPSVGKTAMALNVAWNASTKIPVGVVSVEMPRQQLDIRYLSMITGIDSISLRRGVGVDRLAVGEAGKKISQRLIWTTDTHKEPGAILRGATRLKAEHDIGMLIVDYLQLLDPVDGASTDTREQEVAGISRACKGMATRMNIPVLVMAQLNRQSEHREGKRPILSDLRESGGIEADADLVMMLHRPFRNGQTERDGEDTQFLMEVHIVKQRNGPIGGVDLYFDERTGKMGDWERHRFLQSSSEDIPEWVR